MTVSINEQIWREVILLPTATINDAIYNLEQSGVKIVIVVDDRNELVGTIYDGDIRRGLLKGHDLRALISCVVNTNPLVVPPDLDRELVVQLMKANNVQHIPVVDNNNCVVGLHLWEELALSPKRDNLIVIMAGGKGSRLQPQTNDCPKPMLKIAGKPMIEHIVERARSEGFNKFVFAINYLGHMIEDYFGNGENFGIKIDYLREEFSLGTAGALSLLDPFPDMPIIVTNCDIVSNIRYGDLLNFHTEHNAMGTMAVTMHEAQHSFGVVRTKGVEIIEFEEKPITRTHINAGVYALAPSSLNFLNAHKYCDMPNLFEKLKKLNQRTVAYPMHERWLDVGQPEDLRKANKKYQSESLD